MDVQIICGLRISVQASRLTQVYRHVRHLPKSLSLLGASVGIRSISLSKCLGFLVSGSLGFWVSWFSGLLVPWFLGFWGSWVLGFSLSLLSELLVWVLNVTP
jgi:hypothetical protein